jgi:transcriptional regulator with XRE-family HTH domain
MDPTQHAAAADHLAHNLRTLRRVRGLSQVQMARAAGLPRPTWANLETGAANPTLAVLVRVASALQVTLEELLAPPRAEVRHYAAEDIPVRVRGDARLRGLLPDVVPGLSVERMELPAGGRMKGTPHTSGTREYLACESGTMELAAAGEVRTLKPGEVLVFRGDQPHAYRNPGRSSCVAYSVVLLAPT